MDGTTNIIELKGIGEKSATASDHDVSKVLSYL